MRKKYKHIYESHYLYFIAQVRHISIKMHKSGKIEIHVYGMLKEIVEYEWSTYKLYMIIT